jgi:hypothetical protein
MLAGFGLQFASGQEVRTQIFWVVQLSSLDGFQHRKLSSLVHSGINWEFQCHTLTWF